MDGLQHIRRLREAWRTAKALESDAESEVAVLRVTRAGGEEALREALAKAQQRAMESALVLRRLREAEVAYYMGGVDVEVESRHFVRTRDLEVQEPPRPHKH